MRFRSFYLVAAVLLGVVAAPRSASAAYILDNTAGGNGYVVDSIATDGSYTVYGSDDCGASPNNYTTYTNTTSKDVTLTFNYSYVSHDVWGSYWDPAGYVVDGVYTQLTPNNSSLYDTDVVYSGIVSLSLLAGSTYGFYVYSYDSMCGLAEITVTLVPLPAALPLFAASLFGLSVISRKKRA